MNKTPIAVGLAMIMGISVVFAFDRVKPDETTSQTAQALAIEAAAVPESVQQIVLAPEIEASILVDEAPLILDTAASAFERADFAQLATDENRSLKDALQDMQKALQILEREAALTHRAVAVLERQYQQ